MVELKQRSCGNVVIAKPLKSPDGDWYDGKDIAAEREEWQKEIDKGKVSLAVMDRLQERAENAEAALAKAEKEAKYWKDACDEDSQEANDNIRFQKERADKAEAKIKELEARLKR